jgi:uncharacterized OsmC-like protein
MSKSQKTQRLNEVNGVDVAKLGEVVSAISTDPKIAEFTFRLNNEWQGNGARNRSYIKDFYGACAEQTPRPTAFVADADEPEVLLGGDSAPNPVEWVLHALASCMTTSLVYHAAAKGITVTEVTSRFEGDIDLHGFLGLDPSVPKGYQAIRVAFSIKADVEDERLAEVFALTSMSPVLDTLTRAIPVTVTLDR